MKAEKKFAAVGKGYPSHRAAVFSQQETDDAMGIVESRIAAEANASQLQLFAMGRIGPKSAEQAALDAGGKMRVQKSI